EPCELFIWMAQELSGTTLFRPFTVRTSNRQQKKSDPRSSDTVTGLAQNASFESMKSARCSLCQPVLGENRCAIPRLSLGCLTSSSAGGAHSAPAAAYRC